MRRFLICGVVFDGDDDDVVVINNNNNNVVVIGGGLLQCIRLQFSTRPYLLRFDSASPAISRHFSSYLISSHLPTFAYFIRLRPSVSHRFIATTHLFFAIPWE